MSLERAVHGRERSGPPRRCRTACLAAVSLARAREASSVRLAQLLAVSGALVPKPCVALEHAHAHAPRARSLALALSAVHVPAEPVSPCAQSTPSPSPTARKSSESAAEPGEVSPKLVRSGEIRRQAGRDWADLAESWPRAGETWPDFAEGGFRALSSTLCGWTRSCAARALDNDDDERERRGGAAHARGERARGRGSGGPSAERSERTVHDDEQRSRDGDGRRTQERGSEVSCRFCAGTRRCASRGGWRDEERTRRARGLWTSARGKGQKGAGATKGDI